MAGVKSEALAELSRWMHLGRVSITALGQRLQRRLGGQDQGTVVSRLFNHPDVGLSLELAVAVWYETGIMPHKWLLPHEGQIAPPPREPRQKEPIAPKPARPRGRPLGQRTAPGLPPDWRQRLHRLLRSGKMSQAAVARACKVTRAAVGQWKMGTRSPRNGAAALLAALLPKS